MTVVGLLTDFGLDDPYVAEMKAALARLGPPDLRWLDVTHAIAPGDVAAASWVLRRTWAQLPAGAVHLVVVDPGVGSARPAVAACAEDHWFVGPGNGLAGFLAAAEDLAVWRLTRFQPPPGRPASTTFHGRDLFAPAAAHLAGGGDPDVLGPRATPADLGALDAPDRHDGLARVVWIDRFGNLITDLARDGADGRALASGMALEVAGRAVRGPVASYAEAEPGELVWYWGSLETLEIAARDASAAAALGAETGLVIPRPTP
ncbi:hypothetical protein GF314_04825 [bacterium]|nr:hypothetical protein [bacterium]